MKTTTASALFLTLISGLLWAEVDAFVEIAPSKDVEPHPTKVRLEEQKNGKLLLTLTRIGDLEAWLVVCEKARGRGATNFRYDINWMTSTARKKGIDSIAPIAFTKEGVASLQLTDDLATRSYIVYGGHFKDGTFYTVDVPAFRKNLVESDEGETKKTNNKPIQNGIEIRATEEVILKIGGTAKITIALENHNKTPIQTLIPPKSSCNACWNCSFEPAIHENMAGHDMLPGSTNDEVATIQPGKTINFTLEMKRNKDGIFMKSDCDEEFGCMISPLEIPKGIKEVKMFYQHKDIGADWWSLADEGGAIKFTENRWIGDLKSSPIVIKLPPA